MTIQYIRSWVGLEQYRDQVREISHRIVATDAIVRQPHRSSIATGLICQAMTHPTANVLDDVKAAAEAQNDLFELQAKLVNEFHLEFDFVAREWSIILDPNPETLHVPISWPVFRLIVL